MLLTEESNFGPHLSSCLLCRRRSELYLQYLSNQRKLLLKKTCITPSHQRGFSTNIFFPINMPQKINKNHFRFYFCFQFLKVGRSNFSSSVCSNPKFNKVYFLWFSSADSWIYYPLCKRDGGFCVLPRATWDTNFCQVNVKRRSEIIYLTTCTVSTILAACNPHCVWAEAASQSIPQSCCRPLFKGGASWKIWSQISVRTLLDVRRETLFDWLCWSLQQSWSGVRSPHSSIAKRLNVCISSGKIVSMSKVITP